MLVAALTSPGSPGAEPSRNRAPDRTLWPAYLTLSLSGASIITGTFFAAHTYDDRHRAEGLYDTDPRYVDARHDFARDRGIALGAFAAALVGAGFATYWVAFRSSDVHLVASVDSAITIGLQCSR